MKHRPMPPEIEYERDLLRVLNKIHRAQERGTGTRLSREDVSIFAGEFDLLLEETAGRCELAVRPYEE